MILQLITQFYTHNNYALFKMSVLNRDWRSQLCRVLQSCLSSVQTELCSFLCSIEFPLYIYIYTYIHDNGSIFNVSINTLQEVSLPTLLIKLINLFCSLKINFYSPHHLHKRVCHTVNVKRSSQNTYFLRYWHLMCGWPCIVVQCGIRNQLDVT